jgi:hypothetical protein
VSIATGRKGGKTWTNRGAFIVGPAIYALAAAFLSFSWFNCVLVVLGPIVGFLNLASTATQVFLITAIALAISGSPAQNLPLVGRLVTNIVAGVVVFVSRAILVVAVKALLETAQSYFLQIGLAGKSQVPSRTSVGLCGFNACIRHCLPELAPQVYAC